MATATATVPTTTTATDPQLPVSDPPTDASSIASETPQPPTPAAVAAADSPQTDKAEGDSNGVAKDEAVSDTQKKMRRAERFGMTVQLSEEEKRNTRAGRFGAAPATPATTGSDASKNSEDQKRKARAERFGLGPDQSVSADEETKKKARLAKFGDGPKTDQVEEDKKKARALRFAQPPSAPNSQVNGSGNDIEPKTAIADKTGGEA